MPIQKKFLQLVVLLCVPISITACSSDNSKKPSATISSLNSVNSILEEQIGNSNKDPYQSDIFNKEITPEDLENQKDYSRLDDVSVDIDFTKLSEVVSFSQMNNMFYMYQDYLGQTVKIQGTYYADFLPDINMTYHYILLIDDTNCCQGIMEFRLPAGISYPEVGEQLMIVGNYLLDVDDTGEYPYIEAYDYVL